MDDGKSTVARDRLTDKKPDYNDTLAHAPKLNNSIIERTIKLQIVLLVQSVLCDRLRVVIKKILG